MGNNNFSRRKFLASAATVGAAGAMGVGTLSSCSSPGGESAGSGTTAAYDWVKRDLKFPPLLDTVPDGKILKAGVIGCGGRGSGAAINFLDGGGKTVTITALGDVFDDRLDSLRKKLLNHESKTEIADENCFIGFDAYEKVLNSGVDLVILATPPKFRPQQFEAAVKARKHVFMEKPVAVDPVGVRQIIAAAKMADAAGLKVVTGTQRRHELSYINLIKELNNNNGIGKITGANVYWKTPDKSSWFWFASA